MENLQIRRFFENQQAIKSYYQELKDLANFELEADIEAYMERVDNLQGISPVTKSFLKDKLLDTFLYYSTTFIPYTLVVSRICYERPWELLEVTKPVDMIAQEIITYNDFFNLLTSYRLDTAIKLLSLACANSSHRHQIVTAFKNGDEIDFCNKISETKEDFTQFMNKLYWNSFVISIMHLLIQLKKGGQDEENTPEAELLSQFSGADDITSFVETISQQENPNDNSFFIWFSNRFSIISEILIKTRELLSDLPNEVDEDQSFLCFASVIDKYDINELASILDEFKDLCTACVCLIYLQIKPHLSQKEYDVICDIVNNSNYLDYIDHVCDEVKMNGTTLPKEELETNSDKDPIDLKEALGDNFLPDDFFDTRFRKQGEDKCIGELKQKVIEAGKTSLCGLINFLALYGYIENTPEQKKNWAFILTGFHSDYAVDNVSLWLKDPNILSVIIQHFYEGGKIWVNSKRLIEITNGKTMNKNATLRIKHDEEMEFKNMFAELYPKIKLD